MHKSPALAALLALASAIAGCQCNCGPDKDPLAPAASARAAQPAPATPARSAAPSAPAAPAVAPNASPLIDTLEIGDDAQERAHNRQGEADETGEWAERTYRHSPGGWFSWDLKVLPGQPNELRVTYWGSDERTFDILVDGQKLVTERINGDKPEEFFEKTYTLTPAMTQGRQKVTVRFQAPDPEGYAGGVFGIRMVRPGAPR